MISEKYKCVFVHIPKNAGSSIGRSLGMKISHMRLEWAKSKLQHRWGEFFKWTIVRNPWERFVSLYAFRKRDNRHEFKVDSPPTFAEWLPWILSDDPPGHDHHSRSFRTIQSEWLQIDGKQEVDFIGRFENLRDDFAYVSKLIGYEGKLEHTNRSKHDHYVSYYNDELIDLVYKSCKPDIDAFGYRFGDDSISLL